jgi:uncharacterized membrane protein
MFPHVVGETSDVGARVPRDRCCMTDFRGLADIRAAIATLIGAVALVAGASWSVAVLVGWEAAATVFLAWVGATIVRMDAAETQRIAAREDSRVAAEEAVVAASVVSLVAVGFVLVAAGHAAPNRRAALTGLAVVSVLLAWAAVHVVYALRYARLYYTAPVGGISFPEDEPPDYVDFAYVALTIGMTFQVSDTELAARRTRHTALQHALLSYLFGAIFVATTVNSVAAVLNR